MFLYFSLEFLEYKLGRATSQSPPPDGSADTAISGLTGALAVLRRDIAGHQSHLPPLQRQAQRDRELYRQLADRLKPAHSHSSRAAGRPNLDVPQISRYLKVQLEEGELDLSSEDWASIGPDYTEPSSVSGRD